MENFISLSIEEKTGENIKFLIDDLKNIDHEHVSTIIEKKDDNSYSLNEFWLPVAIGLTTSISYDLIKYIVLQIKNSLKRNKKNEIRIQIQGIEINIKSDSEDGISPELVKDILKRIEKKNEW